MDIRANPRRRNNLSWCIMQCATRNIKHMIGVIVILPRQTSVHGKCPPCFQHPALHHKLEKICTNAPVNAFVSYQMKIKRSHNVTMKRTPGGIYRFADLQLCRQRIESCHRTNPAPKITQRQWRIMGGVGSSDLNHGIENMSQENMSKTKIIPWHPSLPPTRNWSKTLLSARLCPAKWKGKQMHNMIMDGSWCTGYLTSDTASAGKRGWGLGGNLHLLRHKLLL